eukprot:885314-Lingulodinium_polyedra.AAC.1
MSLGGSLEMPELDFLRNLEEPTPVPKAARSHDCDYVYEDLVPHWLYVKGVLLGDGQSHFLRYVLRPEEEHL